MCKNGKWAKPDYEYWDQFAKWEAVGKWSPPKFYFAMTELGLAFIAFTLVRYGPEPWGAYLAILVALLVLVFGITVIQWQWRREANVHTDEDEEAEP